jgi:hypothetical protein
MLKRKHIYWLVLVIVVVMFIVSLIYFSLTHGVMVVVTNNDNNEIKDVRVLYNGGIAYLGNLKQHSRNKKYVNPIGESDLTLCWINANGEKLTKKIEVYFEHNYRGKIEIVIEANDKVVCLHPYPI